MVLESFTISLFVALLLQVLLKLTLHIEHRVARFFKAKPGKLAVYLRFFSAWLVLFLSKLVILGAIDWAFGHDISFGGPLHSILSFIVVVVVMLVAEEMVLCFYQRLS